MIALLLQTTIGIDIDSRRDFISPLNEFAPTFEHFSRGIILVSSLIAFGYMIWGAVDWILAGGDSGKLDSARKKITQAMIGLFILASVGAIFLALQYFLGIEVLDGGAPSTPPPTCINGICIDELN